MSAGSIQDDIQAELQRTVTIVFWHRPDTEPIRLHQSIATFPLLQLQRLPNLVTDLALSPQTYLDTYSAQTSKWEQHTINSVRVVRTGERVLYRIRRSLLEGLSEEECPGLKEELATQVLDNTSVHVNSRKREAEREHEDLPPQKQAHINQAVPPSSDVTAPSLTSQGVPLSVHAYAVSPTPHLSVPSNSTAYNSPEPTSPATFTSSASHSQLPPGVTAAVPSYLLRDKSASTIPIPYHPHPPLKRWPNDYTVAQLSVGFYILEALCSHSLVISTPTPPDTSSSTTMSGPHLTQKQAFERIFGSRYVKSTLCRHRGVWRNAPREIRDEFERYGDDERGIWGSFVRKVEGKMPKGEDAGTVLESAPSASETTTSQPQPSEQSERTHEPQPQASGSQPTLTSGVLIPASLNLYSLPAAVHGLRPAGFDYSQKVAGTGLARSSSSGASLPLSLPSGHSGEGAHGQLAV
ncbi:hypothetical protein GYMLUDRAFT_70654 [Collybiopsis luxurians FD-317 M1]|nr:hypothetical protein GYMLUDRAFT_70654 [Collybiopsis luxurians FD-317 M1]